jgi:hypothetical protein
VRGKPLRRGDTGMVESFLLLAFYGILYVIIIELLEQSDRFRIPQTQVIARPTTPLSEQNQTAM